MSGFVKIHRSILTHWVYQREDYFKAWMWLIMNARYKEEADKKLIKGKLITIERGQLIASIRFLQQAWRWRSKQKVETFLKLLEEDKMIFRKNVQNIGQITICNYGTYQDNKDSERTHVGHTKDSGRTVVGQNRKKEERKEKERSNKEERNGADIYENWRREILADHLFIDSVGMSQKILPEKIPDLVIEFISMKKGLGEDRHKSYQDFKKNFFHWLRIKNESKKPNESKNLKNVGERFNYAKYQ